MLNLYKQHIQLILLLLVMTISVCGFADLSYATTPPPTQPHGTCTTDTAFQFELPAEGQGIISTIVTQVKNTLDTVAEELFEYIRTDFGYIFALKALLTLYVTFYGILFAVGMVKLTLYDFFIRVVKIGLIGTLLTGTIMGMSAWDFFGITVVQFFNDGTDQWINTISGAVLGVAGGSPSTEPFAVVDQALMQAISAETAVTLMAMFFTPPYGPIFGLLLVLGLGTLMNAILTAATVYLMALILKALLFGLAPVFLAFLLFARTRYLFDGWLNQVVNATLQPILLFTFLGFFIQLIQVALANVFSHPVCWTEWSESVRGSPGSVHYWRFAVCDGAYCEPYSGKWSFDGPQDDNLPAGQPIFPIDILGILVLVILADLCARFNKIVVVIASDLAGASVNLAGMYGALSEWFSPVKGNQIGGSGTLPINNVGNRNIIGTAQDIARRGTPGVGNRGGVGGSSTGGNTGGGNAPPPTNR